MKNIEEINDLINNYIEGIFYGDVIKLKACFYKNTCIHGHIKGVNYVKTVTEYLESVKNRKSPKDVNEVFNMKIIGIDSTYKIAMVKVHMPMLGYNYYDYLSLFKRNDAWEIVNKVFIHVE
ncbi:nuclear transport factor 2 family protein [Aquimarina sp. 2201CG1-2-11]|uniref:nuclear transport factor 2 family protein n=1 Tax=Aquimarina discodermiae TaxID=3231043 RepID=UPI003462671D